jgi:GMP synthase-like glutamine amidotransferase
VALHVVQHTSAEYLGLMEDHLEGRNIRFHYCRPFTGKVPLPGLEQVGQGLVLLGGGPWGSAGVRNLPTLDGELSLVRRCLESGKPVLGIGLGAQILALAGGGGVESSPLAFSVGKARRVRREALGGVLPEQFPVAVYGRDHAVLPPGADVLAEDETGRPAIWQLERSLGFAGHPGLKVAMVEDLVMEFEEAAPEFGGGLAALRAAQAELEDALVPIMTGVVQVSGWMA